MEKLSDVLELLKKIIINLEDYEKLKKKILVIMLLDL